jgi:hypothetical protein
MTLYLLWTAVVVSLVVPGPHIPPLILAPCPAAISSSLVGDPTPLDSAAVALPSDLANAMRVAKEQIVEDRLLLEYERRSLDTRHMRPMTHLDRTPDGLQRIGALTDSITLNEAMIHLIDCHLREVRTSAAAER